MDRSDRGKKHVCAECKTKFYDLNKKVVACPICGAKPPDRKAQKEAAPARRPGRASFGRFP